MPLKSVEYIGPSIILIFIFLLKLTVDESFSIEHLKRLLIETAVDIMSLAISFTVSFLIASTAEISKSENGTITWENFYTGLLSFMIYLVFLVLIVFFSKFSIRKYSETEKVRYLILGLAVGYPISVVCLVISINFLRTLGGV